MNAPETDDTLKALRGELAAVAPSPEFAARVRLGIEAAADARSRSWLSGWRWLVPAAAAAAVVIAVFAMSRPQPQAPEHVIVKAPIGTAAAVASVPEQRGPATSTRLRVTGERPGTVPVAHAAVNMRGPENPRTGGPVEPDLVVITNQPAILRALWARVGAKATLVERIAAAPLETVPEIVVNPIEVSPIVIKWLGDPSTAPGVLPIIRKVTADTAERSEK